MYLYRIKYSIHVQLIPGRHFPCVSVIKGRNVYLHWSEMMKSHNQTKLIQWHCCSLKVYVYAFITLVVLVCTICMLFDFKFNVLVTGDSLKVAHFKYRKKLDTHRFTTIAPPRNPYDVYGNLLNETWRNLSRQNTCNSCMSHNFRYVINNDTLCKQYVHDQEIRLLVLVPTIHANREARDAIRDTWLSGARGNTGNVRYAFLLGETEKPTLKKAILEESKLFGDILMEDFVDAYQNLTYKTMMAMNWAATRCSDAQFLLKADDDMFVNIPALLDLINVKKDVLQTAVMGSCVQKAGPIRDKKSKWYASNRMYPDETYPGFCSGTAYVTSINVARNVYEVSSNVPYFYLEDVYVALCIRKLGFKLVSGQGFHNYRPDPKPCLYKSSKLITSHRVPALMLRKIWSEECVNNNMDKSSNVSTKTNKQTNTTTATKSNIQ